MSLVSCWLFLLEPVDLFGDVDRRLGLHVAQLVDLGLELGDRLLEIEEVSSLLMVSPCLLLRARQ